MKTDVHVRDDGNIVGFRLYSHAARKWWKEHAWVTDGWTARRGPSAFWYWRDSGDSQDIINGMQADGLTLEITRT